MRDFLEAIYEYPWVTFFVFILLMAILEKIKEIFHGD